MQEAVKVCARKESGFTGALYGRGEIKRLFWVVNKPATGTVPTGLHNHEPPTLSLSFDIIAFVSHVLHSIYFK